MDLLNRRSIFQVFGRIPQHLLVRGTVVEPAAFAVHQRNHVRRVFADELKKLVTLRQLPADALQLKMLIDRVQVEQQHQTGQPAHPLAQVEPIVGVRLQVKPGKSERDNAQGQRQGDRNRESPKPPLPAFDLAHLHRDRFRTVLAYFLKCLLISLTHKRILARQK